MVGAGPNGLTAAVVLARAGLTVTVYEEQTTVGGGTRSAPALGPGTVVDLGSAVHPFGVASPVYRQLDLQQHGLRWLHPPVPLAHPLDDGPAAMLHDDLARTADSLGRDARAWIAVHGGAIARWDDLVRGVLGPILRVPEDPATLLALAGFGARGAWPAAGLARTVFRDEPARALFAGSAAHAVLPLTRPLTAAFGVLFGAAGMATGWPVAAGGSQSIADALLADLRAHGGRVRTGTPVRDLAEIPPADLVLLDLTPQQVLRLRGTGLPERYRRALARYRYGVAVHKVDYLLDGPVPWRDPEVGRAGTVHVGGTLGEVAYAEAEARAGRLPGRPFVLLAQQQVADPGRAPGGRQVVWAYAHVPHGCDAPAGALVDAQVERFAPGFRDRVLYREDWSPARLQHSNANLVGGDIGGGSFDGLQQVLRPVRTATPYTTPTPGLFLCSSSTPPGGGAHGMCGYHAATTALRDLARRRDEPAPLPLITRRDVQNPAPTSRRHNGHKWDDDPGARPARPTPEEAP